MDLHRVSGEKRAAVVASKPAGVECQPNAAAPLLRDEKARREWLEHELDMCCQVSLHLSMQSHRPMLMALITGVLAGNLHGMIVQCVVAYLAHTKVNIVKGFPPVRYERGCSVYCCLSHLSSWPVSSRDQGIAL